MYLLNKQIKEGGKRSKICFSVNQRAFSHSCSSLWGSTEKLLVQELWLLGNLHSQAERWGCRVWNILLHAVSGLWRIWPSSLLKLPHGPKTACGLIAKLLKQTALCKPQGRTVCKPGPRKWGSYRRVLGSGIHSRKKKWAPPLLIFKLR